jgi:hypothetical protein
MTAMATRATDQRGPAASSLGFEASQSASESKLSAGSSSMNGLVHRGWNCLICGAIRIRWQMATIAPRMSGSADRYAKAQSVNLARSLSCQKSGRFAQGSNGRRLKVRTASLINSPKIAHILNLKRASPTLPYQRHERRAARDTKPWSHHFEHAKAGAWQFLYSQKPKKARGRQCGEIG